jgi:hypothetical protein
MLVDNQVLDISNQDIKINTSNHYQIDKQVRIMSDLGSASHSTVSGYTASLGSTNGSWDEHEQA